MRHALLLVLVTALLAHGAGLRNGFVYDDHRFIDGNPRLSTAPLSTLMIDPAAQTADADRDVWRPLRALGHRLDLDAGLGPFGFHLDSLVAHLLAVALGWCLLRRLLPEPSEAPALLGAMVLAVHPLGVEVVGWASSRGDLYAMDFGCAALLAALAHERAATRTARAGLLVCAGGLAFLSFLGKESAIWVPVVALLAWRLAGRPRRAAVVAIGAGVLTAFVLRQGALSGLSPAQTAPHGGPVDRYAWSLYGTGRTLAHVLWPSGLSVDYVQDDWVAGASVWMRGFTLAAIAVVLATLWLARHRPVAGLLLGWALLAWLPSSSLLVTLRSLINDRGAYPMLLPLGALAGLPLLHRPRAALATALGLSAVLVPLAAARTLEWHDDASLWRATLRDQPHSVRAHLGLAFAAAATDRDEQGRQLRAACDAAVPGSLLDGVTGAALGDWLLRVAGQPAAAEPVLRHALLQLQRWRDRDWPRSEEAPTVSSLAEALTLLLRHDEADALLVAALAAEPTNVALQVQRSGLALWCWEHEHTSGALGTALVAWSEANRLAPDDPIVQALGRRLASELPKSSPPATATPPPGG